MAKSQLSLLLLFAEISVILITHLAVADMASSAFSGLPTRLIEILENGQFIANEVDIQTRHLLSADLTAGQVNYESLTSAGHCLAVLHSRTKSVLPEVIEVFETNPEKAAVKATLQNHAFANPLSPEDRSVFLNLTQSNLLQKLEQAAAPYGDISWPGLKEEFQDGVGSIIHGQFTADSILVKPSEPVKITNWNNLCAGPASYDVASLVSDLFIAYYNHESVGNRETMYRAIEGVRFFVNAYLDSTPAENRPPEGSAFFHQLAGFTGIRLINRIFHQPELLNERLTLYAEDIFGAAFRLLQTKVRISSIERLVFIGFAME